MTSNMQKSKSLNRFSAFFSSPTKTSDAPSTPPKLSSSSLSKHKNKVRKSSGPLVTEMTFSAAWPLPDHASPEPLPTVLEPSAYETPEDRPQLTASPDQELLELDFGPSSPQPIIQTNPAHHFVVPNAAAQRPRSASSSAAPVTLTQLPQNSGPSLAVVPQSGTIMANGYGNHSSTSLLKPKKQQHPLLLKRQKSENALRHNTAPPSSTTRAVSSNYQPNQIAPASRLPPISNSSTMPIQSSSMALTQPKKTKSWLFGGGSSARKGIREIIPPAWITGAGTKVPYDLNALTSGAKVPELWNNNGNVVVFLFPRGSKSGPSFRLNAEHIADSAYLRTLAHGKGSSSRQSVSSQGHGSISYDPRTQRLNANVPGGSSYGNSPNASHTDSSDDSRERDARVSDGDGKPVHLYLPIDLSNPDTPSLSGLDVQKLVLVRNLFAFLVGQSLIATPKYPTSFQVFYQISNLLHEYGFTNMDSSTFGEVASASFICYTEELGLIDVRESPQKAVEGLILGERMRSSTLWNEAFTHAVGRYSDIQNMAIPTLSSLSSVAKQRVERAHMNLEKRILRLNNQLSDFDFPGIFSGIMNSRMAKEREIASFEQWKSAFQSTRRFFINYLKAKHKSWPPKRRKNAGASVPAMSRGVLQGLYSDLAVLYDLMVDRRHPSSRLMIFGRNFPPHMDRRIEALRKVLQEYDQSGSPTYPVMPFDAPRIPRFSPNDDDVNDDPERVPKAELAGLLKGSYNQDTHDAKHPFSQLWMAFEYKSTAGMTIDKVANFRLGSWLFIYCVIQALPMLTVDTPAVKFKEGVEYFLCEPARGRLHWSKEGQQWEWFQDPISGVVTQLAKDTVDLSDEAMYRLSHCWKQGAIWEHELTNMPIKPGRTETNRKSSIPCRQGGQLPTPPASEHRSSVNSPLSQYPVQQPPQHLSLQSLYLAEHDTYSSGGSQPGTPHQSSPQLTAMDPLSGSPMHYPAPNQYHSSPEIGALTEPTGIEHVPVMPGIQEEYLPAQPRIRSRNPSPHASYNNLSRRNGNRESIFMTGFERLPVPSASSPITREQRSARTASMTFDEILAPMPGQLSNSSSPKIPQESIRAKSRTRQISKQFTR